MSLLDKDSALEMFEQFKLAFEDSCNVECRIQYEVDERIYDEVNQIWTSTGNPQTISKDIFVIDNEVKRNGMAESSQILEGVPTGTHKVYLKFADAIFINQIDNYVDKSLKFIIRPNSIQPITLYPDTVMNKIEYFMEFEDMPLSQRFICSVVKI